MCARCFNANRRYGGFTCILSTKNKSKSFAFLLLYFPFCPKIKAEDYLNIGFVIIIITIIIIIIYQVK